MSAVRKRQKCSVNDNYESIYFTHDIINTDEKRKNTESISSHAADKLLKIETELSDSLKPLQFSPPVEYVYNPLIYASQLHATFVKKFLTSSSMKIMFLGMNPGPWGMSQTGIPFGENQIVKEWFQVSGSVGHPEKEHPSRKILGLDCHRSEVSGKKFWGLFKEICKTPESFFKYSFVYNICPLAFMTFSGKNITPAELNKTDQKQLNKICDEAFLKIIKTLDVEIVIGIGKFAEKRALTALKNSDISHIKVLAIPHPSPRNAKHFNTWSEATISILQKLDLLQYFYQK